MSQLARSAQLALVAAGAVLAVDAAPGFSAGTPTVTFRPPSVHGTTARFHVTLKNFTLDPQDVGKQPIAGKGHLHFSMDGGKYDFPKYSGANGKLAQTLGTQGKYSPSVKPTITYRHLPKGKHTLVVHLARNDHSMYTNKGATARVTFRIR
jgi:hypothetical protein